MNKRELFETWYRKKYSSLALESWNGTEYATRATQIAWEAYQQAIEDQDATKKELTLHVYDFSSTLDEKDVPDWQFIRKQAERVEQSTGSIEVYGYERGNGGVIALWDAGVLHSLTVKVRDGLNRAVYAFFTNPAILDRQTLIDLSSKIENVANTYGTQPIDVAEKKRVELKNEYKDLIALNADARKTVESLDDLAFSKKFFKK